jgi:hypothetical protein
MIFTAAGGAYRRYEVLLGQKGLLDERYDFERQQTRQSLLDWYKENGIELE